MKDTRLELCDVNGPLNDLLQKLAGERGNLYLGALKKMLRGEKWWMSADNIPVWKTIKIGTHENSEALFKTLYASGLSHNLDADSSMRMFEVESKEMDLDLVLVSVEELGFGTQTTDNAVSERAQEIGLQLCPIEAGPQLRLQYNEQPQSKFITEFLIVATKIFGEFGHGGGHRWQLTHHNPYSTLNGWVKKLNTGYRGNLSPEQLCVFVKPRK